MVRITSMFGKDSAGPANSSASAGPLPPKFRSLKVRSAVSGRDASCRINGLAETPERFHENAVVSRFPTYGF